MLGAGRLLRDRLSECSCTVLCPSYMHAPQVGYPKLKNHSCLGELGSIHSPVVALGPVESVEECPCLLCEAQKSSQRLAPGLESDRVY